MKWFNIAAAAVDKRDTKTSKVSDRRVLYWIVRYILVKTFDMNDAG